MRQIKGDSEGAAAGADNVSNDKTLEYFITRNGTARLSLDIFEAEMYPAAVAFQQLVGNLVFFSNHGRYEPRLAESWSHEDPSVWTFRLRNGFTCENGEKITPASFRNSLLRSIKTQHSRGGTMVFKHLKGYEAFTRDGQDLSGIEATPDSLRFVFDIPIKEGVLEILSFSPFGYICSDNFVREGEIEKQKSSTEFLSSGPYEVKEIHERKIILSRRDQWLPLVDADSPQTVIISYDLDHSKSESENLIVDAWLRKPTELSPELSEFKLVPEWTTAIVFGNLEKGFFANVQNRRAFRNLLRKTGHPEAEDLWTKAKTFYPSQEPLQTAQEEPAELSTTEKERKVLIRGVRWSAPGRNVTSRTVIEEVLGKLGIQFAYSGQMHEEDSARGQEADIRVFTNSIGGEVKPWTIDALFCSGLTEAFPDSSGKICAAIDEYNKGNLTEDEVNAAFIQAIEEDAVILPFSHFGVHLFLSASIDRNSLSPLVGVIRFDQLRIK